MKNFILNNHVVITYVIEFIAVLVGFFSYKKYQHTTAISFIHILFFIFFIELIGSYPNYYNKLEFLNPLYNSVFRQNYWWFTIFFDVIIVFLFSRLFLKVLNIRFLNRLVNISSIIFLVFSTIFLFVNYEKLFFQVFPFIQIVGSLLIIISTISYFIELILSDKILFFYRDLYFYISVALFMWWIIMTSLSFYDIYSKNGDWNFILLKWQIYLIANLFMYTTFAIGLIVSKPEKIND